MASPIVGALFFGMISAGPGQTMSVMPLMAQGLPVPQCVVCGAGNRQPPGKLVVEVQYQKLVEGRFRQDARGTRIGITHQQAQRLSNYAGV